METNNRIEDHKYSCSSVTLTLQVKGLIKKKKFLYDFWYDVSFATTYISRSEGDNRVKHLKNIKIKRGTGDKLKNNEKSDTSDS